MLGHGEILPQRARVDRRLIANREPRRRLRLLDHRQDERQEDHCRPDAADQCDSASRSRRRLRMRATTIGGEKEVEQP